MPARSNQCNTRNKTPQRSIFKDLADKRSANSISPVVNAFFVRFEWVRAKRLKMKETTDNDNKDSRAKTAD